MFRQVYAGSQYAWHSSNLTLNIYCRSKIHIVGIILNHLASITFHSTQHLRSWSGLRHYDSTTPSMSDRCKLIRSCWKLCHMQVVCVAFSKHGTHLRRVVSLSYFPVFHNIMCLMLIFCRRILRIGFPIHFFLFHILQNMVVRIWRKIIKIKFLLLYIVYKKNAETSSSTILTNKETIHWAHYIKNICLFYQRVLFSDRFLLLLLGFSVCWRTNRSRGYHTPNSQCFSTGIVYQLYLSLKLIVLI